MTTVSNYKENNFVELKYGVEKISPSLISSDFIGDEDEYNYEQIGKAIFHVLIIPIILFSIFGAKAVGGYMTTITFLYSTVFFNKSKEYFALLSVIITLFILATTFLFVLLHFKQ